MAYGPNVRRLREERGAVANEGKREARGETALSREKPEKAPLKPLGSRAEMLKRGKDVT